MEAVSVFSTLAKATQKLSESIGSFCCAVDCASESGCRVHLQVVVSSIRQLIDRAELVSVFSTELGFYWKPCHPQK
jgi:hypothetical protein